MSVYKETQLFNLSPHPVSLELICPVCKETVVLAFDDSGGYSIVGGCDNCGCSLFTDIKLCITAEPQ